MPLPEVTIALYLIQRRRRLTWFVVAVVLAVVTAAVAKYALHSAYPTWRLAILVWGLLYVPWFVAQSYAKNHVFISEVWRARRELLERRQRR